jgi:orotidine-5'-phosphate decarboxylase
MGFDSVQPYLKYPDKGAFLLCRTSNPGGDDLQNQRLASSRAAAAVRARGAAGAGPVEPERPAGAGGGRDLSGEIERVRALAPTLPLLIPGVGAQGGDAVATVRAGWRATRRSW